MSKEKKAMFTVALIGAVGLITPSAMENAAVPRHFADCFETGRYCYASGPGKEELAVGYRLFVPRNVRAGERRPLLVWLHGQAEGGRDNRLNLTHLPTLLKDSGPIEECEFFILAAQCPSPEIVWTSNLGNVQAGAEPDDMLTATHGILKATMRREEVDRDRIYLAGVCSGGNACWEMAMRYPDLFAAIVPTTPGGGDVSRARRLAAIPIWAFQSRYEHPQEAEAMVAAIKAAGGNAHLTLQRGGHDSWSEAFRVHGAMEWMLAQRRGARICWTPPGHRAWKWWHILAVPGVFVAVTAVCWRSEQRRRQGMRDKG